MSIAEKVLQVRATRVKQISHRPDLAHRVHVISQYADSVSVQLNDYADYAQVYGVYAWVHKAVELIARALAPLPVRAVDADGEALDTHPVTELLAMVNSETTPMGMWQAWLVDMMLAGESFIEVVSNRGGGLSELWIRRPDKVRVLPDASPERKYYPRVAQYIYSDDELRIEPEAMIHTAFYNPLIPWRGLAPIAAVREGITIDLFAQSWSKTFLKGGARPDFALISPQGLTATEREDLQMQLIEQYSGQANWHKPIVLEQGITDIKPFAFPPKDIEWLQQREFSRDEVAAVFGVPDELMGYGRDTYENFETAHKVFWTLTVAKLVEHRDIALSHFFGQVRRDLRPGERVETDLSGVGVLQDDLTPKLEQLDKLWSKGVPFNLLDERLGLGIGRIDGGDVGFIPIGLVPVVEAGKPPEPVPEALRPFAGQDNEPTTEDEGEDDEEPEEPTPEEGQRSMKAVTRAMVPAYGSPEHVKRWKAFATKLDPYETAMARALKVDFQREQNTVLRNLRELFEKGIKRQLITITVDQLLDWPDEIRLLVERYLPDFAEVFRRFGEGALAELGVGISFDVTNPLVLDVIRKMTIQFAEDITRTTQEEIAKVLREILLRAEDEGLGTPQVQRLIYDEISQVFNVRKSDYETERIARTEMGKSANAGSMEAYRQSGVVGRKGWLAALDDRTRSTHIDAHSRYMAEPIPLDAMFEVGADRMDAPGNGSITGENINCRCTLYPVVEGDSGPV